MSIYSDHIIVKSLKFSKLFNIGKSLNDRQLLGEISRLNATIYPYLCKMKYTIDDTVFDAYQNPFFQKSLNDTFIQPNNDSSCDDFYRLMILNPDVTFNPYLLLIYAYVGNVNKQINMSSQWFLFSFKDIYTRFQDYKLNHEQNKWMDIGLVYAGMGHIDVLRMNVKNGELFMQSDGGSNGYERDDYYNIYMKQELVESMYIPIEEILTKITTL